jgi:hypothetical protein
VASLGLILRHRFGRCLGRFKNGPVKVCDGTQHLAAVPKRNAEFRQILICEIRKHAGIDVILSKALSVLREPERCQPLCDRPRSTFLPAASRQ